jgi:enediyne biosynthesis protein E4
MEKILIKMGLYDAIPTVYFSNNENERKEVIYNTRDDLIKQITAFKNRFESYAKFALASIYETFSKEDMQNVLKLQANYMKTSFIENLGNGEFKMTELPSQVQTAPIFGMLVEDFNHDGNVDILTVGNDYGNEISVGRLDAFNGLLLTGNGKGNFEPISLQNSGFYVPGDAKALAKIKNQKGENLIISTQNRGELKVFKMKSN